jgi:hypothetical protein
MENSMKFQEQILCKIFYYFMFFSNTLKEDVSSFFLFSVFISFASSLSAKTPTTLTLLFSLRCVNIQT